MSGIENHNYPAFHEAAANLREAGHFVVSPAEMHPDAADITGDSSVEDYRKYLANDFLAIAQCEGVALMEGVMKSKGALLEIHFALTLGIPCYPLYADGRMEPADEKILRSGIATHFMGSGTRSLHSVLIERAKQNEKWGEQNHEDLFWLAILGEEFGETAQAILHTQTGERNAGKTRKELVHTVAVGLQWLECMDRRN